MTKPAHMADASARGQAWPSPTCASATAPATRRAASQVEHDLHCARRVCLVRRLEALLHLLWAKPKPARAPETGAGRGWLSMQVQARRGRVFAIPDRRAGVSGAGCTIGGHLRDPADADTPRCVG